MPVHLGISPIGWSNDDLPELGGDIPLETCLAEARQAGFAGIELGNKFPCDPAALRPLLAGHGLALVSGWYGGRLLERSLTAEIEAVEPHLALLAEMGCGVMVFAEISGSIAGDRQCPLSKRPRLGRGDWRDFGEAVTHLAEHLAERGVAMAYHHHHMGTVVEDVADIDRLMEVTGDSVGLLLDTGHLGFAGADPAAVAARYRRRINHVHCKDLRSDVLQRVRATDASFLDAVLEGVFTVPGDGRIDFIGVLGALAPSYSGWLVVEAEQDPATAPPLAYARMGFAQLSAAMAKAGLAR